MASIASKLNTKHSRSIEYYYYFYYVNLQTPPPITQLVPFLLYFSSLPLSPPDIIVYICLLVCCLSPRLKGGLHEDRDFVLVTLEPQS